MNTRPNAGIDAYPLYWPLDWKRTERFERQRSRYELTFVRARDEVSRSVRLMRGHDIVVSTNVPVRRDGLPLAGQREPDDPGVAVYWTQFSMSKGSTPRVMACDHWATVRENLRAMGLALEGLRAIERSGASQILERAFAGFAALPATTATPAARTWREVLHLNGLPVTRDDIDTAYKQRVLAVHPDHGGTDADFIEVCQAREQALREVQ
ncbi:MAG TPA: hypothetical protein VGO53_16455 [Steroidobacteraceae bacterium]|jgi:hypothetical protein|nr:hypothetical protein [Steroidobacteraceae bacterium]